jgi:hypothetical protein
MPKIIYPENPVKQCIGHLQGWTGHGYYGRVRGWQDHSAQCDGLPSAAQSARGEDLRQRAGVHLLKLWRLRQLRHAGRRAHADPHRALNSGVRLQPETEPERGLEEGEDRPAVPQAEAGEVPRRAGGRSSPQGHFGRVTQTHLHRL